MSSIFDRTQAREETIPSSYVIGDHFERFIKEQLQAGRYVSASEIVREALRLLEEHEELRAARLQKLRAQIEEGLGSGPPPCLRTLFSGTSKRNTTPCAAERTGHAMPLPALRGL